MYQLSKIEQLACIYVKTEDDDVFGDLIRALIPWIDIQLSKKYLSLRMHWEDMSQEVLLKLWENRKGLMFTKSKKLGRFLQLQIRTHLFRAAKKIKKSYDTFNPDCTTIEEAKRFTEI